MFNNKCDEKQRTQWFSAETLLLPFFCSSTSSLTFIWYRHSVMSNQSSRSVLKMQQMLPRKSLQNVSFRIHPRSSSSSPISSSSSSQSSFATPLCSAADSRGNHTIAHSFQTPLSFPFFRRTLFNCRALSPFLTSSSSPCDPNLSFSPAISFTLAVWDQGAWRGKVRSLVGQWRW